MIKKILLVLTVLFSPLMSVTGMAENGPLSLKSITGGEFYAHGIYGVNPLADGESYSQLVDGKRIVVSSFKTGEQTGVLFDADNTKGKVKVSRIDGYIMSPNQKNILLRTQTQSIYRHSTTAVYYIYNVQNRTLAPLSDGGPQECPLWSPDGNMVGFVREGNLFLVKLLFDNAEVQITKDGKFNSIINGKADWVYEEEFVTNRSFDFNADATMLAWIRYDESQVPLFSFPMYKGMLPEMKENAEYPGAYEYKYPIAGQPNSKVSVHTFDIKSRATREVKVPLEAEGYIPRIAFSSDPDKLLILTQNRHQDNLQVWVANPRSTECRCIVTDEVKPSVADKTYTLFKTIKDGFILMSERSGFAHLYQYNLLGTLKREIGKGQDIITDFYGYDEKTGTYYYQAQDGGPLRTGVYKCDAKGKVTSISTEPGQNSAIFSGNFKQLMLTHHSAATPPTYTLRNDKGKVLKTLQDNAALKQKIDGMNLAKIEFFQFQTQDGVDLNGIMVKPADFDANKKYPVILFQYSGPGSQQVLDSWYAGNCSAALLERYMAQEGFVSIIVDGRGTGGRGAEFEKQTYLKLGQLESHDQVETAIYLSKLPWVDAKHIGIWGWSFGGFNTLMSMSEGRPVFYAGVAVAPPTSWRYYDTVYTERFMRTPKENQEGYDCSPITRAKNLSGSLLIIHGLADDNVHFRNVAEYTEALVHADKDFRQLTYTNRNHSIYGGNTRNHLFRQLINHFKDSMK
ncbi:MAG: DPP IV N-terminal domain-containing protein [Bacteroidaceae bacterium]|nr:DPP IV N-terminal domain-containing protein [Bacteroidaceae bacterium]